jgi:small conductance mechanosensitive channel
MQKTAQWAIGALPSFLLVVLAGFVALKTTGYVLRRLERFMRDRGAREGHVNGEASRRIETLISITGTALRAGLWCMIVLLALVQLGVNVGPLIAGAGLVGLAIGFGAQELVRDVISGFFMLLENDVRRGDWAIINGVAGYVESVTLRTIVLRDEGGVVHVFQNGKITSLSNTTKDWSAVLLDVAISYDEDVDRAIGVMTRVAVGLARDDAYAPRLLSPLEVLGVDSFDDTKTVVRVRLKTDPLAQFEVGREYRKRLIAAFHKASIVMPEAAQTVHLVDRTPRAQPERTAPDAVRSSAS